MQKGNYNTCKIKNSYLKYIKNFYKLIRKKQLKNRKRIEHTLQNEGIQMSNEHMSVSHKRNAN